MSLRLIIAGLLVATVLPFLVLKERAHAFFPIFPFIPPCAGVGEQCAGLTFCCEGLVCEQPPPPQPGQAAEPAICTPCRGEGMPCSGAGSGNCCWSANPRRNLVCIQMTQNLSACYLEKSCQPGTSGDDCPLVNTVQCNGEGWECNAGGRGCCAGLQGVNDPNRGNQCFCTSNQPAFQTPAYVKIIEPLWPAAEALRNQQCSPDNPWCIPILPGWLTFTFYFMRAFLWILNVAIGFVVIWILISGFLYMTSGNNQSQRSDAVTRIQWSIAGLLLLLFASVIMRTLNSVFFT